MKHLYLFLMLLFAHQAYNQQYVDLLTIHHLQHLEEDGELLSDSNRYFETSFDALLPIPINEKLNILTGFMVDQVTLPDASISAYYSALLKLGVNIKHTERLSATYILLPKISSDFKKIKANQLQIGAFLLGKYKKTEHLNLSFGAYNNAEFFGPLLVPMIGFYYQKKNFELKALVPLNAETKYTFNGKNLSLGARWDGFMRSYLDSQMPTYVEKKSNEVGPFIEYKLGNFHLRVMAGLSLGRNFNRYTQGDKVDLGLPLAKIGEDRTSLRETRPNGFLGKFSLIYRLPTS